MGDIETRFWEKVDKSGECWLWTAAVSKRGYGRFRLPTGHIGAHVQSYILTHGPVPEGKEVHHVCENPPCVRPDHLKAVTHRENLLASDTIVGINARKTRCINGHPFDDENTRVYDGKRKCRQCGIDRKREIRAGNIGEPVRRHTIEPMPETAPPPETAPAPAPEREPVREPEKVPS